MNAQTIVGKILQDARGQAQALLREARDAAERSKEALERRIADQREAVCKQAEQDAQAQEDRMLRMAELEQRKDLLAAKRAVMDRAFDLALEKMLSMPARQARAYNLERLCALAQGGEALVIGDPAPDWFDASFLEEANQALRQAGRPGGLTLSADHPPLQGGFVLRRAGLELNCSYGALLKTQRLALEGEVAGILFP